MTDLERAQKIVDQYPVDEGFDARVLLVVREQTLKEKLMPGILLFPAGGVKRIVKHLTSAKQWSTSTYDPEPPHPQLILVKDDGIYILSNGVPADMEGNRRFVTYAEGVNPNKAYVWDLARALVGGDDFAEYLDLSPEQVKAILSDNFLNLQITVTDEEIETVVIAKVNQR